MNKTKQTERVSMPSIESLVDAGYSSQEINRMIDAESELDLIERDEV